MTPGAHEVEKRYESPGAGPMLVCSIERVTAERPAGADAALEEEKQPRQA